MHVHWRLLPLVFAALIHPGCGTGNIGDSDLVMIDSQPSGALVYRDGELLGATPLAVSLPRRAQELRLVRPHFRDAVVALTPVRTEAGQAYVRFGVLEDLGAYYNLAPNPVRVELVPELIPFAKGSDPYAELTERALLADALLEQGEISADEHRYIIDCLTRYFIE